MKGRASQENIIHRFSSHEIDRTAFDDLSLVLHDDASGTSDKSMPPQNPALASSINTELIFEKSQSIISYNKSPDVPFDRSINPYRGCEHGCIYCFARPSHSYWDYSPGLDFETKIIVKHNAVEKLREAFEKPNYQCKPIAIGVNTDAYQPVEKYQRLTRELLKVCLEYKHPVSLLTKSQLILRDIDILQDLARDNLVSTSISITSLSNHLKRLMEPRASSGLARLQIVKQLAQNVIPVSVLIAPIIPAINDHEIENLVKQSVESGATHGNYILLRLPFEVKTLFIDWLERHFPHRKNKVIAFINECRDGQLNQSAFGERMVGKGIYSQLFKHRFRLATRQYGLNNIEKVPLNCTLFRNNQPTQLPLI